MQVFERSIVDKYVVGELDASGDILFGRISIIHFPLFIHDEFIVRDLIRFTSSEDHSLVSDLGIRIDGEEMEIPFALERFSFSYGSDAFDDSIFSTCLCLVI